MRSRDWNRILIGLALTTPIPYVAQAETYLTEDQAVAILFPGVAMNSSWMELSLPEIKKIEKASSERVSSSKIRVWWGPDHQAMIIDRVLGKHAFITYAVAISSDGKVQGIEIMEYLETYGYQVREPKWRQKFVGKNIHSPLKIDKDIPNISGATLSSVHITNGVRRVLQTYEILKSKT